MESPKNLMRKVRGRPVHMLHRRHISDTRAACDGQVRCGSVRDLLRCLGDESAALMQVRVRLGRVLQDHGGDDEHRGRGGGHDVRQGRRLFRRGWVCRSSRRVALRGCHHLDRWVVHMPDGTADGQTQDFAATAVIPRPHVPLQRYRRVFWHSGTISRASRSSTRCSTTSRTSGSTM